MWKMQKENQNRKKEKNKKEYGREPLCKQGQGFTLATCKQLLSKNKLAKTCYKQTYKQKWVRKKYKILKQMQETTLVYLLFDGIGPPCPGLKKHLSWMGEVWLNGDGGEGAWVA